MDILGIPCALNDKASVDVLHKVLTKIKDDFPTDFERLKWRILRVAPHPNPDEGDLGECKTYYPDSIAFFANWEPDNPYYGDQVEVFIVESDVNPTEAKLVTTIAHELGHAATTRERLNKVRCEIIDDSEWANEAIADLYMIKWGIEYNAAELEATRDPDHHRIRITELRNFVHIVAD